MPPIEVIYENGVLRPLAPLPDGFQDHQHLTITIEPIADADRWLADAAPAASLDAVRHALANVSGTLAQFTRVERDDR